MNVLQKEKSAQEAQAWSIGSSAELALSLPRRLAAASVTSRFVKGKARSDLSAVLEGMVFPALWLFIGLVSAYDTYLVMKFDDSIWCLEVNPLGRYLLRLDGGKPALFVGAKFLGTILALGSLCAVYRFHRAIGFCVTAWIAALQFVLFVYLLVG